MTQSPMMKKLKDDFTTAIKSILIDLSDELITELFNVEVTESNLVSKCIHQACDEIACSRDLEFKKKEELDK